MKPRSLLRCPDKAFYQGRCTRWRYHKGPHHGRSAEWWQNDSRNDPGPSMWGYSVGNQTIDVKDRGFEALGLTPEKRDDAT